jgi:uncharacterized membrane protein
VSDFSGLATFIQRYYIDPIVYDTSYNPVDTVTFAAVLGLSLLLLIRLLSRWKVSMDDRLVIATLPYILAGSSLRVIEDADLVAAPWRYLLITPLIFFLVFSVASASLILTRRILGDGFHAGYAAIGFIWTALNLSMLFGLGVENGWVIGAVFLLGSILAGAVSLLQSLKSFDFLKERFSLLIIYAHMLDASSTYFGVDWFAYHEKHVVPTYLINLAGSAAIMFPLKLAVLLPVLYIVDRSLQEPSLRSLIKLTLITLGLAPAIRNTLRLALGI